MERNDAPKEIIKEVIKKVPTIIYKDKIIYKEKIVPPQIEYRDKEVVKIEYRDKEVPTIIYKDKIVREIEYRDVEVIKEVPTIKEVIKEVTVYEDFSSLEDEFRKLYNVNYPYAFNAALAKMRPCFYSKYPIHSSGYDRDLKKAAFHYMSKNKDLFSKYEIIIKINKI
jgi:hypothetical protein